MPKAWSEKEVEIIVEDYFQMLKMEPAGEKFNKTPLFFSPGMSWNFLQKTAAILFVPCL